jgi:hypothetical protein
LSGAIQGISSLGMAISSFKGLMDTIEDPSTSGWEKFGAILTSVSMVLTSLGGVYKGFTDTVALGKEIFNKDNLVKIANIANNIALSKTTRQNAEDTKKHTKEVKKNTVEIEKNTGAKVANEVVD